MCVEGEFVQRYRQEGKEERDKDTEPQNGSGWEGE